MAMERITVRVTDDLLGAIHTEARQRGQRPSSFIRECVLLRLQPNGQQKTPEA